MKNSKNILLGAVLLTGVFAMAAPASADYYRRADFRNDRRELYQDRRELVSGPQRSYTAIDATARVGLKSQTTGVRFGRTGANYAMTDWIIVPGGIGNKMQFTI